MVFPSRYHCIAAAPNLPTRERWSLRRDIEYREQRSGNVAKKGLQVNKTLDLETQGKTCQQRDSLLLMPSLCCSGLSFGTARTRLYTTALGALESTGPAVVDEEKRKALRSHSQVFIVAAWCSSMVQAAPWRGGTCKFSKGASGGLHRQQQMSSLAERTLWLGELEPWMTEDWLRQLFMSVGEQITVKSIRDKSTGLPANYCFLEFGSSQGASKSLAALNGTVVPGTNKALRMNWSAGGGPGMPGSRNMGGGSGSGGGGGDGEFSMFVGDLAYDVTDAVLLQLFQSRYNSVRSARIVTDANTGANKGYGFVKFSDESDQRRAMMEMQGVMCGNRPIRVSQATPKHRQTYSIQLAKPTIASTNVVPQAYAGYAEPDANVYIGNITPTTTDEDIRQFFAGYGDIVGVKVPPGRGCAFVQFVLRRNAELAINNMNGFLLCGSRVKLSWGKSTQAIQRPVGPPPPEYYQAAAGAMGGYGYAQQQGGYPQQPQQGYAASMPGTPLTPTGDFSGQQYQQQQQQHNPQALHQAYYSPSGAHPPAPVAPPVQDPRTVIPVSDANAKFLDEREAVEAGTWVSSTWSH